MDAATLLRKVGETYAGLKTLAVEMLLISESGDDDSFTRHEQRARAWFAAPDRLRIEQGGRRGSIMVADGVALHSYFALPRRYGRSELWESRMLPGWFRPEFPFSGGPVFLFGEVAKNIASAELLREDILPHDAAQTRCHVLVVSYAPPPHPALAVSASPLTFWIDSASYLVRRVQGEVAHRMPAEDVTHTSKHTLDFTSVAVNEPIAPETFEFVPPADAVAVSNPRGRGACMSFGGGGGSISRGPGEGNTFESYHSHEWAGETLIEHYQLRWRGTQFTFERRLRFSDDGKRVLIGERITTPVDQTDREVTIDVP